MKTVLEIVRITKNENYVFDDQRKRNNLSLVYSNLLFKLILKKEISSEGSFEGKNIVFIF